MSGTLITGFTPFDNREVNSSWIAASSLGDEPECSILEIPVVWGKPLQLLAPICETECPSVIISMGEGREGWFDIETLARNTRKERADNHGDFPAGNPILESGPVSMPASIDAPGLLPKLIKAGFPCRISGDAGAFLCEETLYTLEYLKLQHPALRTVVFVHLPPYGSEFRFGGRTRSCDREILAVFASTLRDAVLEVQP